MHGMIELTIETWSGSNGTEYRWSLWRDGRRLAMGPAYPTAAEAEAAATAACIQEFGMRPDRVTAL
jgi:hypothetical protein